LKRLDAAGREVSSVEYKKAPHSFDNLLSSTTPAVSKGSQTTSQCNISEKAGVLINTDTGKPFIYSDKCVTYDPSTGYEPTAAAAVHNAVLERLKALLR